jgi:hypothetical protein
MKTIILISIFCLALRAQQPVQLVQPPGIGVWSDQNTQLHGDLLKKRAVKTLTLAGKLQVPPSSLELTFKVNEGTTPTGVCSVALLEARTNANDDTLDRGIATKPSGTAVPIPQARVPAPPCHK